MVFLDTCIWIELCSVKTPIKPNEIRQAHEAGILLASIMNSGEEIVTFREQLIEIISAVQKVKMREYNNACKGTSSKGVSNIKEFRLTADYPSTKCLCIHVCEDVQHFAKLHNIGNVDVNDILSRIDVADINDCMYYDYCLQNNVKLYTFDADYTSIDIGNIVNVI